jgi:hypothetical protein
MRGLEAGVLLRSIQAPDQEIFAILCLNEKHFRCDHFGYFLQTEE